FLVFAVRFLLTPNGRVMGGRHKTLVIVHERMDGWEE
ncbi:hypothetical protein Tco_1224203, partial [Tanacetum coccineum]